MKNIIITILLAALLAALGCGGKGGSTDGKITFVATINPAAAIVREIAGDRANVVCLLNPASSPHTYSPRPSDMRQVEAASALIFVGEQLDGWAAKLPATARIELMTLLPAEHRLPLVEHEEHEGGLHEGEVIDPHFWMDPAAVKAILPALAERMAELDSEGAETYRANAARFAAELDALDLELAETLRPVIGRPVIMFHPSMQYMLKRYGLEMAGVIEPFPGKEPTPDYIVKLKKTIADKGVKAVFTEPQLREEPARVVAEETAAKVYVLDPIGGVEGRESYAELLRYNAKVLAEALK